MGPGVTDFDCELGGVERWEFNNWPVIVNKGKGEQSGILSGFK